VGEADEETNRMGKNLKRRNGQLYTVTVTCSLTPPFNFISETQHKTWAAAYKAGERAHRKFKDSPGLLVVIALPLSLDPDQKKTAWARILAV
jgi:hypothetical protein